MATVHKTGDAGGERGGRSPQVALANAEGLFWAPVKSSKKRGYFVCVFFPFLAIKPFISEKVNAQLDGFFVFHVELF